MRRTQIYLTEHECAGLSRVVRESGKKQSELIRDAIDSFLEQRHVEHKQTALNRLAGIWRSRSDVPDFAALRRELDRTVS